MVKWVFSILQNTWKYSVYADNRKLDIKFKYNKYIIPVWRSFMMDIRQMKYFKTIVEEGTISKAAKKLHMAQPPLSMQLN